MKVSEGISLKEYLRDCYQSITGESINDELSSDDIFDLIAQYSADSLHTRIEWLCYKYSSEKLTPLFLMFMVEKNLEVKGKFTTCQSHIIVQICKRLRNVNSFQAIEFIQNIADLNCIAIKLGEPVLVVLKLQRNC